MSKKHRSLELIVAKGEQKSEVIGNINYFVYELLTQRGKWFQRKIVWEDLFPTFEYGSPRLPTSTLVLEQALKYSGIKVGGGGNHGLFGFDTTSPVLIYVPGETSEKALGCLNQYRERIDEITDASGEHCPFKVRPAIVK